MPKPLAYWNGAIVAQSDVRVPVESPTVKYGAAVFEGIRAYWNEERGNLFVFRLQEHLDRLDNAWPLLLLAVPLLYGLDLARQQPLVLLPLLALLLWSTLSVRRLRRRARGDVPAAVAALIAGISLLDAMLLAGLGQLVPMLLALGAFALTLLAQRRVSGT